MKHDKYEDNREYLSAQYLRYMFSFFICSYAKKKNGEQ